MEQMPESVHTLDENAAQKLTSRELYYRNKLIEENKRAKQKLFEEQKQYNNAVKQYRVEKMGQKQKLKSLTKEQLLLKFSKYESRWVYTITLRKSFHELHFKTQYKKTSALLKKWLKKHGFKCYLVPELTLDGNIHYHGMIFFNIDEDYFKLKSDNYKRQHSRLNNWINRSFGTQKIYAEIKSFTHEYVEDNNRNKSRTTSFNSIYKYIHKEQHITKLSPITIY